jgi:hypothetical protein
MKFVAVPVASLCASVAMLFFGVSDPAAAQQTCSARCPDGSMSERFNCSDSSYVPMCQRRRAPAAPAPQSTYRPPTSRPTVTPPPLVSDAERQQRDAAARAADLRARDAAAGQLKGIGGAPSIPSQTALKGLTPPAKASTKTGAATVDRTYTYVGNGLVGGTGWRTGFYSPVGASAEVRERALMRWREQARLNGGPNDTNVDTARYNFVIGVAASTNFWVDLGSRVAFDQLRNGNFTRGGQEGYNALKGKRFDELGCHSNGAMICLAALVNRDIAADRVVLYGPQITPESLRLWNGLVQDGKVKSVTMYVNENDPVAPMALLANRSPPADQAVLAVPMFYRADALRRVIHTIAPRIIVRAYACGTRPDAACHEMARYTAARNCDRPPPAAATAGTKVNGRAAAAPPSPTCRRIP